MKQEKGFCLPLPLLFATAAATVVTAGLKRLPLFVIIRCWQRPSVRTMLQSPAAWPSPSPLPSCENNSQKFDSRLVSRSKLVADETPAQFPFSLATFSFSSSSSFHQSVERDRSKTDQVCQVETANIHFHKGISFADCRTQETPAGIIINNSSSSSSSNITTKLQQYDRSGSWR